MKVKCLAPTDDKRKVYQRTNPRLFLDEMTQDGAGSEGACEGGLCTPVQPKQQD